MAAKPDAGKHRSEQHKRFTREDQRRALFDVWEALRAQADAFARQQSDKLFGAFSSAICVLIKRDAAGRAKLDGQDEQAYAECAGMYQAYRQSLLVYESRKAAFSSSVRTIMDGIHAVISSRIKLFDEAGFSDNPLADEKDSVYEQSAARAAGHILSQAEVFNAHCLPECLPGFRFALLPSPVDTAQVLDALDQLQELALNFCFRGFYAFYREGLQFCLSGLDDLNRRTAARFYFDLMENELLILDDIMKVQIIALEHAANQSLISAVEKPAVQQILAPLREGYQRFSRAVVDVRQAMRATEEKNNEQARDWASCLSYEAFERELLAAGGEHKLTAAADAQVLTAEMEGQKHLFLNLLDKETDALFEQVRLEFFKGAYRFHRTLSDEAFLADEMTDAFERLRRSLPAAEGLPAEAVMETEILKGITETIEIKIESLKESTASFNQNGARLVTEFTAGLKEANYDNTVNAYAAMQDHWVLQMADALYAESAAFFDSCFSLDYFQEHKRYYMKREDEYQAKVDKALLNFKKETILYEVNTYEEIITYSVSRLRDSSSEKIKMAVALMDETQRALDMLLKKNNIIPIQPAPHEMFNGREHEVLMAEKQEGFNKGEIVKLLASGYKQKDIIILRANVIAAR